MSTKNKGNVTECDNSDTLSSDEINKQKGLVYAWDALPSKTKDRLVTIKDLRRKGLTIEVIAKLLKVSTRTIQRDLELLRESHCQYVQNFDQIAEIGDAIEFYDEIEGKFMELMRVASETNEVLTWTKDAAGKPTQIISQVPDHSATSRYGALALTARKTKNELLQRVGMMSVVPDKIELSTKYDVSKMGVKELEVANKEVREKISLVQERIKRINGPDPLAEYDHQWEN